MHLLRCVKFLSAWSQAREVLHWSSRCCMHLHAFACTCCAALSRCLLHRRRLVGLARIYKFLVKSDQEYRDAKSSLELAEELMLEHLVNIWDDMVGSVGSAPDFEFDRVLSSPPTTRVLVYVFHQIAGSAIHAAEQYATCVNRQLPCEFEMYSDSTPDRAVMCLKFDADFDT